MYAFNAVAIISGTFSMHRPAISLFEGTFMRNPGHDSVKIKHLPYPVACSHNIRLNIFKRPADLTVFPALSIRYAGTLP
jgi:hypothetical protein